MRLQINDIEKDLRARISFGWGAWGVFGALAFGLALVLGSFAGVKAGVSFLAFLAVLWVAAGVFLRAKIARRRSEESAADAIDNQRVARLREHLLGRFEPASIEELMAELGWSEKEVINGLQVGMERHRLVEELDLDSGHWTYAASADVSETPGVPSQAKAQQRARGGQRELSIPDKLLKLSRLRAAGALGERDFQTQKMRLLQ